MPLRLLLHVWLVLLLVFAQQEAIGHALSHLGDPVQQEQERHGDKGTTHHPSCERCIELSGLGAAATANPPALSLSAAVFAPPPAIQPAFRSWACAAYLSRGPPHLA